MKRSNRDSRQTGSASKNPNPSRPRPSLQGDWGSPMAFAGGGGDDSPHSWVGATAAQQNIQALRQRILNAALLGSLLFAIIAFGTTLGPRLAAGQFILIGIFATMLVYIALLTWRRDWPYRLRAYSFVAVIAFLGLSTLISDGLYGNGRIFLLAVPVVSAILLGAVQAVATMLAVLALIALMGVLMVSGVLPAPVFAGVNADIDFWTLAFATAALVGASTTISLVVMFGGLQTAMQDQQRLRSELTAERLQLEERIEGRTQDLQRRLVQIRTAAEITRRLGAILDPQALLQSVVELVQERFGLYYVGVFLLDDRNLNAVLRAGSGEAGQKMLARHHHLPLDGHSMIAWTISRRQARIALDVGQEAVRFENPDLPATRSELALPLLAFVTGAQNMQTNDGKGEEARTDTVCLGAITVQSDRSAAFDEDDITVLQGIADSLATALQNAALFQQVQHNLEEIRTLNRRYLRQAWQGVAAEFVGAGGLTVESGDDLQLGRTDELRPFETELVVRDQSLGRLQVEMLAQTALPESGGGELEALTAEDRELVQAVAAETALALENIRLLEETQRRAAYERLLAETSAEVRQAGDLDGILRALVRQLGRALAADESVVELDVASLKYEEPK